jgi:DNA repair photolyase
VRHRGRARLGLHHLSGVRVGQVRVTSRETRDERREIQRAGRDPLSSHVSRLSSNWLTLHRTARGAEFIGIVPTRVLNPPSTTGMAFWSLNPYVGCEFGCAYCYARTTHRWTVERASNARGAPRAAREAATLPSAEAFERRILVKQDADRVLARTLDPARLDGLPIVIGSATDPYQPAERHFQLTRRILEVFLRHEGLHLGIITKSALVARDAELLAALARRHEVSVHISLASTDGALLRQLEPRSPAPHARLRAMRRLTDAGVRVGMLMMPLLPGLMDSREALGALLRAGRAAGAQWAAGGALRMGPATRQTLLPWLETHRPALARRYRAHYGGRQGVHRAYHEALQRRISGLQREVGFDPEEGRRRERRLGTPARMAPMQAELFAP